jgi:hypothetical protein
LPRCLANIHAHRRTDQIRLRSCSLLRNALLEVLAEVGCMHHFKLTSEVAAGIVGDQGKVVHSKSRQGATSDAPASKLLLVNELTSYSASLHFLPGPLLTVHVLLKGGHVPWLDS